MNLSRQDLDQKARSHSIPMTFILMGMVWLQLLIVATERNAIPTSWRWMTILIVVGLIMLISITTLIRQPMRIRRPWNTFIDTISLLSRKRAWFGLLVIGLMLAVYTGLLYGPLKLYLEFDLLRFFLFWCISIPVVAVLIGRVPELGYLRALALFWLSITALYRVVLLLPAISSTPFTLAWSEGSRYYYASLLFSGQLYGQTFPLSPLHPSRYILQAIPFIIPGLPILIHRVWQVCLWIGTATLSGMALSRYHRIKSPLDRKLFSLWVFVFLLMIPVYYHLLLGAIFIFLGYRTGDTRRTLIFVLIASAWAGISRINWFPMPATLAAVLYLMEDEPRMDNRILTYLMPPFLWILAGMVAAFVSSFLYAAFSGNSLEAFATSFTSSLLWYRLLPNSTYPPGILLSLLVAALPLCFLTLNALSVLPGSLGRIRRSIIVMGLAMFLLGGLVVSVKIGGGGNLHNMDAFLVLLAVTASFSVYQRHARADLVPRRAVGVVFVLIAVIATPIYFTLNENPVFNDRDTTQASMALADISRRSQEAVASGGEILFISDRQLLTFNYLEGVPLEPSYEKLMLMEMAMAGNDIYLSKFYRDLQTGRYSLIVSDPIETEIKDRSHNFSEEGAAWITKIAVPMLNYYHEVKVYDGLQLSLLVPNHMGDGQP